MLHKVVAGQFQCIHDPQEIDVHNLQLGLDRFVRILSENDRQRRPGMVVILPSILNSSSGPLIPALAITMSTVLLGESFMARLNIRSWSSHDVTSQTTNATLLPSLSDS